MLHGRGARTPEILWLRQYLNVTDYALIAPQATCNSWYPYSFLTPPEQNEPWMSSAIELLKDIVHNLSDQGILTQNIYFLGGY